LEVKSSLQTTIAKEELWLGHDIFHTHCTLQDMDCNDIFVNKRCENIVSNYMVEKLKLPTKEHPQWHKKDNKIIVSQHSIVSFSIGNNYKEYLWGDVIFMDTWRPCQYDHCPLYNGYANTYTFVKDVIEIKLAPLPLNKFNDGKEEFKLLGLSFIKKPFKDKTKLFLLRLVPKPPWENVGTDFVLGILWTRQ